MNFSLLSVPLRTPDNWVILRASEKQWVKIIFQSFGKKMWSAGSWKITITWLSAWDFLDVWATSKNLPKQKKIELSNELWGVSWRWMMCFADTFKVTHLWSFSSKWIKDWINKAQEIVLLFTLYITLFK